MKNIYLLLIINLALNQAVLQIFVYIPYVNTLKLLKSKRTTTYVTFLDASTSFDRLNQWTFYVVYQSFVYIFYVTGALSKICMYNGEAVFLETFM